MDVISFIPQAAAFEARRVTALSSPCRDGVSCSPRGRNADDIAQLIDESVDQRSVDVDVDVFIPAVPLPDNEAACWVEIYCRLGLFPDDNDTIVEPIKVLRIGGRWCGFGFGLLPRCRQAWRAARWVTLATLGFGMERSSAFGAAESLGLPARTRSRLEWFAALIAFRLMAKKIGACGAGPLSGIQHSLSFALPGSRCCGAGLFFPGTGVK
jgi:hypothetical protein